MTNEEILRGYQAGTAKSDEELKKVLGACMQSLGNNLTDWFIHLQRAFNLQNEELALLRTLEHHLRHSSGDEQSWAELRGKLDAFRARIADMTTQQSNTATVNTQDVMV